MISIYLTERWQVFNWHFLPGWVKGHGGDLEGLISFGQLAPLLAGSSGNHRGGVWPFTTGILRH